MAGEENTYLVDAELKAAMGGGFVVSWLHPTKTNKFKKPRRFADVPVPADLLRSATYAAQNASVSLRITEQDDKIVNIWAKGTPEPIKKERPKAPLTLATGVLAQPMEDAAALVAERLKNTKAKFDLIERGEQISGTAPYNFVRYPNPVPPSRWGAATTARFCGSIKLSLTAKTRLLVAGREEEVPAARQGQGPVQVKRWLTVGAGTNTRFVIPGSSIKGMLRNVFEIVTASNMQPVSSDPIALRNVQSTPYIQQFVDVVNNTATPAASLKAGFLVQQNKHNWKLFPCSHARIEHTEIATAHRRMTLDEWARGRRARNGVVSLTAREKYEQLERNRLNTQFIIGEPVDIPPAAGKRRPNLRMRLARYAPVDDPNRQPGVLVVTGGMQGKHREFVFYDHEDKSIDLTSKRGGPIHRFLEQRTKPQKELHEFLLGVAGNAQYPHGGIPVFFNEIDGEIQIGFAHLFRIMSSHNPASVINKVDDDLARRVFGTTDTAGRVFFSHAVSEPNAREATENVTAVLGQPHPSCVAHYLAPAGSDHFKKRKDATDDKDGWNNLDGWFTARPLIRGWKRYWHRPIVDPQEFGPPNDNQDTQSHMRPLEAGATFTTTIEFRDLSLVELGALLFALNPGENASKPAVHKLGMGKALGWGSVEFSITGFDAWEPAVRYRSLLGRFNAPAQACTAEVARAAFIAKLNELFPKAKPHIEDLRQMLDFERAQKTDWSQKTRPLKLPEFKPKALLRSVSEVYKAEQRG